MDIIKINISRYVYDGKNNSSIWADFDDEGEYEEEEGYDYEW